MLRLHMCKLWTATTPLTDSSSSLTVLKVTPWGVPAGNKHSVPVTLKMQSFKMIMITGTRHCVYPPSVFCKHPLWQEELFQQQEPRTGTCKSDLLLYIQAVEDKEIWLKTNNTNNKRVHWSLAETVLLNVYSSCSRFTHTRSESIIFIQHISSFLAWNSSLTKNWIHSVVIQ